MTDLSAQSVKELQDHLNEALKQAHAAQAAQATAPAAIDFCAAYSTARPIMVAATYVLPILIPGIGSTVASALGALMSLGDKACPTTMPHP